MAEYTVGGRIEQQDAEAFQLLQLMLKRPALFVGTPRFDYIDFLFGGYCWGRQSEIKFLPSEELQYWLLHAQSASLHGSLSGASLFYRCFGTGDSAFENCLAFLDAPMPPDIKGIDDEIHAYEKKYDTVRYDWEDDVPSDHYPELAKAVYTHVQEMLARSGLFYDDIKIYIRKEPLFNQVRFLFHGNNGWEDDTPIISNPEYHALLIALHANVRNAHADDLRNCGYEVFDHVEYDGSPWHDTFTDKITFLSEFTCWKEKQMGN